MKIRFLLLTTALLFAACKDDDADLCDTTDLTYNNDIAAIINNSCTLSGCHASGTTTTFPMGNYQKALVAVGFDRIIGAINHENGFEPMPYPAGTAKLDQCDIDKLTAWINDGAPE